MKTISYCLIFTSLILFQLGSHTIIYDLHENLSLLAIIKSSVIGLLTFGLNWLISFFYHIFTLHNYQIQNNFDKFLKPVFQIVSWFVIVKLYYQDYNKLNVFMFWINTCQLLSELIELNPINYSIKFEKFLHYYHIFNVPIETFDEDQEQNLSAEHIKPGDSSSIFKSSALVESSSLSTINSTPKFDISRPSFSSDKTLFNYTDLPKATEPKDIPKVIKSKVDKLYSVSPKNTYHLNTASAVAFDYLEEIEEDDQSSSVLTHELTKAPSISHVPSYGTFDVVSTIDVIHKQKTQKSFFQDFQCLNWLFPLPKKPPTPTLKSKLSSYSLINQSAFQDFESGIQKSSIQHQYFQFYEFVTQFFDFDNHTLLIDPIFKQFGVLLIDFPLILIFLNCINNLMFNWLVIVLLYKYSIFGMIGAILLKLFKQNYIYSQTKPSYFKYVISLESIFYVSIVFSVTIWFNI